MPLGRLLAMVVIAASAAVIAMPAWSQTASQVPPTAPPAAPVVRQTLVFPGTPGLGAPDGAEDLNVLLAGVEISGGKPEFAAKEAEIVAALSGRRVSVAEIFSKARDLEAAYTQAGFVLVRVVVPAQTLNDGGTLKLTVVEGFIERIDAENVPERVRARVVRVAEPLLRRPDVTIDEIERRLLLAGDTPGIVLKTALGTGEEPGGTILSIEAEFDSIVPFLAADNTLPASLGTWVVHGGVDFNGLLGVGETIYIRASTHPEANNAAGMFGSFDDDPRYRSLTSGFIIPVGINGLTLNVEGMITQTTPAPIGPIQTSSMFEKLSARWEYPFVRSRKANLNGTFEFAGQNEYNNLVTAIGDLPLFQDRIRVVRAGVDGSWTPAGTLTASAKLSVGLDVLNARRAAVATPVPLSRQGADATFQKLEAALGYSQTLSPHFAFSISGRAQTSFGQALLQSEQFSIASLAELSGFDSGAISGDSGWVVRFEPSFPFNISRENVNLAVAPYVFGAVGQVHLHRPTVFESATTTAGSVGVGVRVGGTVGKVSPSLQVEYAWAFRNPGPDQGRLTVAGSLQF